MEIEIESEESEKKSPDKYEVECWANDVLKAQEIMQDPEKMKMVSEILKKKKAALDAIPVKSMGELKARKKAVDEMPDED